MPASVIYTPLRDNKTFLKVFFWEGADLKFEIEHKGENYSLRNTSRIQKNEIVG